MPGSGWVQLRFAPGGDTFRLHESAAWEMAPGWRADVADAPQRHGNLNERSVSKDSTRLPPHCQHDFALGATDRSQAESGLKFRAGHIRVDRS